MEKPLVESWEYWRTRRKQLDYEADDPSFENRVVGDTKRPLRVLMLAYEFPPINFSGTERPYQFAKHFPAFNISATVFSQKNFISYCEPVQDDHMYLKYGNSVNVKYVESFASILNRHRISRAADQVIEGLTGKKKVFSRLLLLAPSFVFRACEWEWRVLLNAILTHARAPFDVVWATGPPWFTLKLGYRISRFIRKPLVSDFRDPWTYGPLWNPLHDRDAFNSRRWEKRILKHSRTIVFTSPLTTKLMRERNREIEPERMQTITNGVDASDAEIDFSIRKHVGFVISHTGRFAPGYRDPEIFLQGLSLALEHAGIEQDIRVQFVGPNKDFEERILSSPAGRIVRCIGQVSRHESKKIMFQSDVLLMLQTIQDEGKDVIAGKLFEYLDVGAPILGVVPRDGGDAWLISRTQSGIVTGIDSPCEISDTIIQLWEKWKAGTLDHGPIFAKEQFSRSALTGKLAHVFRELVQ